MTDALRKILEESNTLSESAKAAIVQVWETKLGDIREELAANLRDEFDTKFTKDKNEIVEAMELMIRDTLTSQVQELDEAKKDAMSEKVKTKKVMKEAIELLHNLVKESLTSEIREFRADRLATSAKVSEVDKFVKEGLTKELEEFHEERRKLVEDRVQHKINATKELAETKQKMVGEMAKLCEEFIREHLTEEMTQLKSELVEAKRNYFGKKIFEAFAAEYGSSFFNERKEITKILKVVENQNKKLAESAKELATAKGMLVESENKTRITQDRLARTGKMNELCGSLAGSKRKLMEELLEKVPTQKLTENFQNYLPTVLNENRKVVSEGKTVSVLSESTGNKETLMSRNMVEDKKVVNDVIAKFQNMRDYNNNKTVIN